MAQTTLQHSGSSECPGGRREFRIPAALGVIFSALALYGVGYLLSVGAYSWVPPDSHTHYYVWCAASALLLFAATNCAPIRMFLYLPLGRALGRYSFPLYLVHILILMSLGMLTFLLVLDFTGRTIATAISVLTTILGTFAVSHLLGRFELWWIPLVNRTARRFEGVLHWSVDRDQRAVKSVSAKRTKQRALSAGT